MLMIVTLVNVLCLKVSPLVVIAPGSDSASIREEQAEKRLPLLQKDCTEEFPATVHASFLNAFVYETMRFTNLSIRQSCALAAIIGYSTPRLIFPKLTLVE